MNFRDALGGCDRASLEMHLDGGRDRVNSKMHLEAEIE